MYDMKYDNIIDKISEKYHIDILDVHRKLLVALYNASCESKYPDTKTFEYFCNITMLNAYLEKKYPTLDLYSRAYASWALN
jgi:hypothetical protein